MEPCCAVTGDGLHAGVEHLHQGAYTHYQRDEDKCRVIVVLNTTTKTQTHAGVEHLHQVALNTLIERQRHRHMSCDSSAKHNHKDTNTCGHSASLLGDITHITNLLETKTQTHLIVVPYKTTKTQTHAGIEHLHQVALNTLIERQRQRHVSCDSRVKNRDTDTHLIVVPCTTTKTQPHV